LFGRVVGFLIAFETGADKIDMDASLSEEMSGS
jgi:hypothetical protein